MQTTYDEDYKKWGEERRAKGRKNQAERAAAREESAAAEAAENSARAQIAAEDAEEQFYFGAQRSATKEDMKKWCEAAAEKAAAASATATTNDVLEMKRHLQEALADAKKMRAYFLIQSTEIRQYAKQMAEGIENMNDRLKEMEDHINEMRQDLKEQKLLLRAKAEEEGKLAEVTKDLQRLVLASGRNVDPSKWLGAETNDELRVGLDV
jgi:hypothetical protein